KVSEALLLPRLGTTFEYVGPETRRVETKPPPKPQIKEKQFKGRTMYVLEQESYSEAMSFLSERMFIFGNTKLVEAALEKADQPDTSLFATTCRKMAQENHGFLLAANLENASALAEPLLGQMPALSFLQQCKACYVTAPGTRGLEVRATLTFSTVQQ